MSRLSTLQNKFLRKKIKITTSPDAVSDPVVIEGVCKNIHMTPKPGHFNIEMEDGQQYNFYCQSITDNTAEQIGVRTIELIPEIVEN